MKALTFSRLCLIGALILGLFSAWSATAPGQLREYYRGGQCHNRCSGISGPNDCSSPCTGDQYACKRVLGDSPDCNWESGICSGKPGENCHIWESATDCPDS